MKRFLIVFAVVTSTGWLWLPTLEPTDISEKSRIKVRGVWVADGSVNTMYKLTFHGNGDLDASPYTTYQSSANPTFKLRWRITREGSLVLIFTPSYLRDASRFFGIPAGFIRDRLKGNQLHFQRERNSIYVKTKEEGESQLLKIRPLKGMRFRFEIGHPNKLMIGKRVFVQIDSGGGR